MAFQDSLSSPLVSNLQRTHLLQQVRSRLFAPVDVAVLVYFRLAFAGIMLWEVWRYTTLGRIERYFIRPDFHFTYWGFDWVKPLPGDGMYILFLLLAVFAACIGLGLFYRLSALLFFLGFTYMFLLEQAIYLNHFYLVCIISFLMIILPAHRQFSLDALRRSAFRSDTVPAWTLWLLRLQIGLVYFFGGVAKLNGDWLQGEPMRMWLASRMDFPVIGQFFTQEWMVAIFTYGGLLFDLLFFPFVLWKPTRWFALFVAAAFHLTNARLFNIGIFPWFMLAANLIFITPDWPRRLFRLPVVSLEFHDRVPTSRRQWIVISALGIYFLIQILIPLRHHLYPTNVHWSEEGHRFSWRMKLRDKSGSTTFFVTDPHTATTWSVDPETYLTYWQADEMNGRPDMILQFSHYLAEQERLRGHQQVEVRAWVPVSLNGRPHQLLVDPSVDLASQPRTILASPWILPLYEPLVPDSSTADYTLLITRHERNYLFVLNLTNHILPLAPLRLGEGTSAVEGQSWLIPNLESESCVSNRLEGYNHPTPVVCNTAVERLFHETAHNFADQPFDVYYDDQWLGECEGKTCLIRLPARLVERGT
mgnify:CR=1 FL=1